MGDPLTAKQEKRARKKANQQSGRRDRELALLEFWAPTIAAATGNHATHVERDVSCVDCVFCQDETFANTVFFVGQDTPAALWVGPQRAILGL